MPESRRTFMASATALTAVFAAGCLGDDDETGVENGDENGDENGNETNDETNGEPDLEIPDRETLTLRFETENGEPVSHGIDGRLSAVDGARNHSFGAEIEAGVVEVEFPVGDVTVTVESTEGEFETVEETYTLDADNTEFTIELEGATSDADREAE